MLYRKKKIDYNIIIRILIGPFYKVSKDNIESENV
jgi:hypothetical protein